MTAERTLPPLEADERTTLTAFLDAQRATLAIKCDGLTGDQLRERAVPASTRPGWTGSSPGTWGPAGAHWPPRPAAHHPLV